MIPKYPIPRAWTASITYTDGRQITTTIHGTNPTDAEEMYRREHPDAVRVIVRSVQP